MPKNSKTAVQISSVPTFTCACGYSWVGERFCDLKPAMKRHTRFCSVAKERDYVNRPLGEVRKTIDYDGGITNTLIK
jgi:hypothetical protein